MKHTFALELMTQVRGKQTFNKLVIDGKSLFDDFVDGLEKKYESELDGIFACMDNVANLKGVPHDKYHPLSDGKDGCREHEFKSRHLRVYAIEQIGGKIVVMGGTKSNQKSEISVFRKLKKQYLQSIYDYEIKRRDIKK